MVAVAEKIPFNLMRDNMSADINAPLTNCFVCGGTPNHHMLNCVGRGCGKYPFNECFCPHVTSEQQRGDDNLFGYAFFITAFF